MKQRYCIICNDPLHGNQRKYCLKCKHKEHLKQMNKNYKDNKCKWLCENGQYNLEKQRCKICGSFTFCEHRNTNFQIERNLINKELDRLHLHLHPNNIKINKKDYNKYKTIYHTKIDNCYIYILLKYNTKTNNMSIKTIRK